MRLVEKKYSMYLEDIDAKEIRFKNLSGKPTGSKYDDPNKPKHEIVVWIDDMDILNKFKEMGVTIGERVNSDTGESRYSVRFKAYPKMKWSALAKAEKPYPKVIIKDGDNMTGRLQNLMILLSTATRISSSRGHTFRVLLKRILRLTRAPVSSIRAISMRSSGMWTSLKRNRRRSNDILQVETWPGRLCKCPGLLLFWGRLSDEECQTVLRFKVHF